LLAEKSDRMVFCIWVWDLRHPSRSSKVHFSAIANELITGGGITSWTFDAAGSGFTLDTITSDGSIGGWPALSRAPGEYIP